MDITILGATGRTGRFLIEEALRRGDGVTAIARRPERITAPGVRVVAGDVEDPASIAAAVSHDTTLVAALGTDHAGILTLGARAAVAAAPARLIWLGAYGTGESARAAGPVADKLGALLGDRLPDKVQADGIILAAGGTVFHAGLLSDDAAGPVRRTVPLTQAPPLDLAVSIGRATVAAAMLDEAHDQRFPGEVVVPLVA